MGRVGAFIIMGGYTGASPNNQRRSLSLSNLNRILWFAPRRTRALAAICQLLNDTQTVYPGTNLILIYSVKPHPGAA
jgi:hypothetical protein